MARRIPVVISQAPAASADARQLEEDLVADLMFEQDIDVSVVPHLPRLTEGTTGLLCLEGIKGDFVLLTWLEAQDARSFLAERGIHGRVGRMQSIHSGDKTTVEEGDAGGRLDRKIYIFPLEAGSFKTHLLREIRRIRDEAQIRTLNVEGLGLSRSVASPASTPEPTKSTEEEPTASDSKHTSADSNLPSPAVDELDQLLDQLDALDL